MNHGLPRGIAHALMIMAIAAILIAAAIAGRSRGTEAAGGAAPAVQLRWAPVAGTDKVGETVCGVIQDFGDTAATFDHMPMHPTGQHCRKLQVCWGVAGDHVATGACEWHDVEVVE